MRTKRQIHTTLEAAFVASGYRFLENRRVEVPLATSGSLIHLARLVILAKDHNAGGTVSPVDARRLAEAFCADPLMTLAVLRHLIHFSEKMSFLTTALLKHQAITVPELPPLKKPQQKVPDKQIAGFFQDSYSTVDEIKPNTLARARKRLEKSDLDRCEALFSALWADVLYMDQRSRRYGEKTDVHFKEEQEAIMCIDCIPDEYLRQIVPKNKRFAEAVQTFMNSATDDLRYAEKVKNASA